MVDEVGLWAPLNSLSCWASSLALNRHVSKRWGHQNGRSRCGGCGKLLKDSYLRRKRPDHPRPKRSCLAVLWFLLGQWRQDVRICYGGWIVMLKNMRKPWHSHCCQHTCLMKNNSSRPLQLWGFGEFDFCRLGGWCCCRGVRSDPWADYVSHSVAGHALRRAQGCREGLWSWCGGAYAK